MEAHKIIITDPDYTVKWREHKLMTQAVALKLIAAGLQRRGERMSVCSDVVRYKYCRDCGCWHVDGALLCRDRLCPTCNWRLSLRRYAIMQRAVAPLLRDGMAWGLITLTVRNVWPDELGRTIDRLMDCWHRVCQRRDMRATLGWARGIELTYNRETGQVHPHLHILACWAPGQDRGPGLANAWLEVVGRAGLVAVAEAQHAAVLRPEPSDDGRPDMTKAILETYKYAIKGSDLLDMPARTLRVVAQHWGGRRLMALGGVMRSAVADLDADDPAIEPVQACRSCGSAALDTYIARWSMGESAYKIIQLAQEAAKDQAEAVGPPDPDAPVRLHTVNGDMILYPSGVVVSGGAPLGL